MVSSWRRSRYTSPGLAHTWLSARSGGAGGPHEGGADRGRWLPAASRDRTIALAVTSLRPRLKLRRTVSTECVLLSHPVRAKDPKLSLCESGSGCTALFGGPGPVLRGSWAPQGCRHHPACVRPSRPGRRAHRAAEARSTEVRPCAAPSLGF